MADDNELASDPKDAIWSVFKKADKSCNGEGWVILDLLGIFERGVTVETVRAELAAYTEHVKQANRAADERNIAVIAGWVQDEADSILRGDRG